MGGPDPRIFYATLMLIAGLGIPVFAAFNGTLGARWQNPGLAAATALLVAFAVVLGITLMRGGFVAGLAAVSTPPHLYLGGVFIVAYILGITWVAPRFGVGNAIAFVLLGQLLSMAVIDHFGLFGAPRYPFSLLRLAGLVLMAAGVFLTVRRY